MNPASSAFAFTMSAALLLAGGAASAQEAPRANAVDFVADEGGLTVLKRPVTPTWLEGHSPSNDEFSTLCIAPCRALLDESRYQFAVRRADGALLPGPLSYDVRGPATFRASVVSHADTRAKGWYVLGGAGGAGVIATTTALSITCGEDRECAKWTSLAFWGGLGALSVGVLVGLPMVLEDDELTLSVVPGTPLPAPSSRLGAPRADELLGAWRGLTLVGRL
jgi:hypothetical protein